MVDPDWLTPAQLANIRIGHCPDCDFSGLMAGPQGGNSTNMACAHCGNEFNVVSGREGRPDSRPVTLVPGLMGHRNGVPGEPNHRRLREVFGIVLHTEETRVGRLEQQVQRMWAIMMQGGPDLNEEDERAFRSNFFAGATAVFAILAQDGRDPDGFRKVYRDLIEEIKEYSKARPDRG